MRNFRTLFIVLVFGFIQGAIPQSFLSLNKQGQNDQPRNIRQSLNFNCPDKNGRYPTNTCDGYIECKDGVPEEKTCEDGLLFNAAASPFSFPCQYPIDVDCSGRESTQPPQSTPECPRQYGYFPMGDANNCGQFKNCVAGRSFIFDCPEGLAWNEQTYRCDWPGEVNSCNAEAFLGFECPKYGNTRGLGAEEYRNFRSPHDCHHYYVCVDQSPRMYNCGEDNAYNEITQTCDSPLNVTGCEGLAKEKNGSRLDVRYEQ